MIGQENREVRSKAPSKFAKSRHDTDGMDEEDGAERAPSLECFPTRGLRQQNKIYGGDQPRNREGREGENLARSSADWNFFQEAVAPAHATPCLVKGRRNPKPFMATFS